MMHTHHGYRFHTRQRDARRKTQNSSVTLEAMTPSFASAKDKNPIEAKVSYYGRIVDMFELDYYGQFTVALFKCEWYTTARDNFGLSYVYFSKKMLRRRTVCPSVSNPYVSDKNYVMKTIPRDLFRVSHDFESDSPVIYAREPCELEMIPSLPNDNNTVALVRKDLLPEILNIAPKVCAKQRYEEEDESEAEYMEDESQGDEYMADESQDEPMEDVDNET
ncbi:hypothetical protein PIB30_092711 [Stylosanthes scabra]|uniref:DUF4216 domain-containing protein n=1 Tax=Stylosanthes scabra TaxID=79078 RepID=A0ABU6SXA6_9FABA|nr:hypothetical protein [Stylosanthes scabra]